LGDDNAMKAIVQHKYGAPDAVLELKDIDQPVVGDDEVLVRVHAASVNPADWHVMRGSPRPDACRWIAAALQIPLATSQGSGRTASGAWALT
jgi:NADPH:quinone reductase-like Zn-dependent oxidoreductase